MARIAPVLCLVAAFALSCGARPATVGAEPVGTPPPPESLAKCLARKGVRLFGAHWCQPCHEQLDLFGKDAPDVPYTDCQPEGSVANIPECDKLDIQTYPTWRFPDGYKALGVRSLKWLSESTSCPLK